MSRDCQCSTGTKRGSILVIVLGFLFCLFLYATTYFNYMMASKRLAQKLGRQGLMSEVAYAFATLAIHKMQYGPLLAENSGGPIPETPGDSESLYDLYQELSKPRDQMGRVEGTVNLEEIRTSDLYPITKDLVEPLLKMGTFGYSVTWLCQKQDFEDVGLTANRYRREKRGQIRLKVRLEFRRGDGPQMTEEYHFLARVKVAAALTPILSRFSLYLEAVESGASGGEQYGLNQVKVDENGEVMADSRARPLILDNDGDEGGANGPLNVVPRTMRDLMKEKRGLVYLGSQAPVVLNLAMSNAMRNTSSAGETFQLHRKTDGFGFTDVAGKRGLADGKPLIVREMEVGMSGSANPAAKSWYDLLSKHAPRQYNDLRDRLRLEHSSIFRLMGSDANRSPTLVFGDVLAGVLNARIYAWEPLTAPPWSERKDWLALNLYGELAPFITDIMARDGKLVPLERAGLITRSIESLRTYNDELASLPKRRPYNLGLAQCFNQRLPDPWSTFPSADPLYAFFDRAAPSTVKYGIPEPLTNCVPGASSLRDLGVFLSACRDLGRVAYTIEVETSDQLWKELSRRGLYWRETLVLSGFILVRSKDHRLVIDREVKYLGNGGLLLEEGDIEIRAPIRPLSDTRRHHLLQVVALNGDIRLTAGRDALIQAHLLASGRVAFSGVDPIRIRGGIAAARLFDQPEEAETFPGGTLEYLPEMAAMPAPESSAGTGGAVSADDLPSEKSLLSFSFEPLPMIHD